MRPGRWNMAANRRKLTKKLVAEIVESVRAGGHPDVAFEAAGVPLRVAAKWLREGERSKRPSLKRELADGVREAQAQARLAVERALYADKPESWLKTAPARAPGATGAQTNELPGAEVEALGKIILGA